MFKKILVANRGEIAIRVMNAARELGIETYAVYHEVDKHSLHTISADYALEIVGDTPKQAYLDAAQIISLAIENGCEAIHPGYGFLSENASFSKACKDAEIKFIGPNEYAIEVMGNKTAARELMQKAGVPIVPGTKERITDLVLAKEIANEIGYPILLKAAAGGGGKGMRKVDYESDFIDSYNAAQREARNAFGDDTIYMEKYIVNPKHIEIQVLADEHGNCIHLAERDCSIQRRHQKVIEEAPSTVLDEKLRAAMGKVAVDAAKACQYVNAGTIEFLLDKDKNFYFLEMNTRLQVEHPVSELITGVDLAKEQIKIAAGYPLPFEQDDIVISGHAIEARIYAEDPLNNFMPDIGKISYLRNPDGIGVRVDGGIERGDEVSINFDPMLAKLIVFGQDREEAIEKMDAALSSYKVVGSRTVIPFLKAVMQSDRFRNHYFDTGFIEKDFDFKVLDEMKGKGDKFAAAIAAFIYNKNKNTKKVSAVNPKPNDWKSKRLNNMRKF
ncbi:MAG: acetyl-CoA carboxylase biotin carboxylase subunit [Candidatus Kapaibacterium sp.]|nr:acetyl-CoA carboxylase biotin carboxylase subunit [Ignavibacteriota bacterium]